MQPPSDDLKHKLRRPARSSRERIRPRQGVPGSSGKRGRATAPAGRREGPGRDRWTIRGRPSAIVLFMRRYDLRFAPASTLDERESYHHSMRPCSDSVMRPSHRSGTPEVRGSPWSGGGTAGCRSGSSGPRCRRTDRPPRASDASRRTRPAPKETSRLDPAEGEPRRRPGRVLPGRAGGDRSPLSRGLFPRVEPTPQVRDPAGPRVFPRDR